MTETAKCPKCDYVGERGPGIGPHYGYIDCPTHKRVWLSKNEKNKKRKTNIELRYELPIKYQTFCWWCGRHSEHIKNLRPRTWMEVHHIIPVENEGTNDRDNLMLLCKECHDECHRKRELLNRYITK